MYHVLSISFEKKNFKKNLRALAWSVALQAAVEKFFSGSHYLLVT